MTEYLNEPMNPPCIVCPQCGCPTGLATEDREDSEVSHTVKVFNCKKCKTRLEAIYKPHSYLKFTEIKEVT